MQQQTHEQTAQIGVPFQQVKIPVGLCRRQADTAAPAAVRKVASYIKNHPNLPDDKIPYWDFDAPDIPAAPRDASAAAVMASGLIELSQLDKSKEGADWLELAEMQIRSLSSPEYLAEPETNGGFILKHSVGNYNKNSEVDVPLSYADYYYVEALLRLKKLQNEN